MNSTRHQLATAMTLSAMSNRKLLRTISCGERKCADCSQCAYLGQNEWICNEYGQTTDVDRAENEPYRLPQCLADERAALELTR